MVYMPVSTALENWRQEDHGSKSACLPHLITYVVCVFHLIRVISLSTLSHVHTLLTIGRARSRQWAVGSVLQVHTAVYPVYTAVYPVYIGMCAYHSVCVQCTQGLVHTPVCVSSVHRDRQGCLFLSTHWHMRSLCFPAGADAVLLN